ncbi:MAG TPA: ABC transporter permease [Acidimicrobiales bacterium]|nr:ABC transporter permease [Acidimicrobiales bacterium]
MVEEPITGSPITESPIAGSPITERPVVAVGSSGAVAAPSGAQVPLQPGAYAPPPASGEPGPKGSNGLLAGSHSATVMAFVREAALLPVLAVLIVVGALVSPVFLTVSNMSGVGQQISSLGVVVVGESLILLVGEMDLSLEGTYGFAPMVAAWLIVPVAAYGQGAELSPYLGILICLVIGAGIGMVNGFLIVRGRLNGFIVTLGMTVLLAGMQLGVVKGQTIPDLPGPFSYLGAAYVGQLPVSLIATFVIFVAVGLFLRYHRAGRAIYAVGGNPAAARAAGIKVNRVRTGVYVAGGVLAALGGLMEAGRVSAVTGTQGYGEGIIFEVFAAAVIGGVSLKGGRGNMVGAATGVVLLGLVQNILDLANVSNYWVEAMDGAVILFALILARMVGGEAAAE